MPSNLKESIVQSLHKFEKNFQPLVDNKELKIIVSVVKKMRSKRKKQVEQMLSSSIKELRANYKRERKALIALGKKEVTKTKKVFNDQVKEFDKIKSNLEKHFSLQGRKKTTAKKATTKKKMATKNAASKTTKKVATKKKTTQKKVTRKT